MNKRKYFLSAALFIGLFVVEQAQGQDLEAGKALFTSKCASCHTITKAAATGPGLEGVGTRRTKEWLHSWIRDSKGLIASGDSAAQAIFAEYNQVEMTQFPDLTEVQIDDILHYISEGRKGVVEVATEEQLVDSTGRKISRADAQVKIWTKQSEGVRGEVVVPMIVLAVFLVIMYFAAVKVPGYPE
jgi:mono/diheme cytochrome c family protein